jgi:D-lactate dehydrogenase
MAEKAITSNQLAHVLKKFVPPERIHIDDLTLTVYSRAADFYEYRPRAVVKARTEGEVRGVLGVANDFGVPVTFRAAGTSLSGQCLGTGIICDISGGFQGLEVRDGGNLIWCQPGPTGEMVDRVLLPLGRRIGPDPGSLSAARMGGIVANNASGMNAGVKRNCYSMLHSMRVVLVDGRAYDSALETDHDRFEKEQTRLAKGLLALRREVLQDAGLAERIKKKFSIKCTTGYGINAIIDFERPLDIFVHLMVGSEGTLGFISEVVLKTLPLHPARSTSLLLFEDISRCAEAVPAIEAMGAQALELMSFATMKALHSVSDLPGFLYTAPEGSCSLLIDFWRETQGEIELLLPEIEPKIRQCKGLINMSPFTHRPEEHHTLWDARSRMFGHLGQLRAPGTELLTEDMAVPFDKLVPFVQGLEAIHAKHGYDDAIILGHISAGNLHFILIENLQDEKAMARYKAFILDAVALVADDLGGSLKAEHGTGRAIAPFVEREWGSAAYGIMKRLKVLADPNRLLNPDIIISDDPELFFKNARHTLKVWDGIDKCVECGFCEHVCPSRLPALTPRQRIQASRKHAEHLAAGRSKRAKTLWREYEYGGVQMCAADGMCHTQCPVGINTGWWTDHLRAQEASHIERGLATFMARRFGLVEEVLRGAMDIGALAEHMGHLTKHVTKALRHLVPFSPVWSDAMGAAPPKVVAEVEDRDFVYYPACVSRIMGSSAAGKKSVAETVLEVAQRAGITLFVAQDAHSTCCGQIWEHKGFEGGFAVMANRIVERMWQWSRRGRIPIVCDVSTCTETLTNDLADVLTKENARCYKKLHILDINEWLKHDVLPKLKINSKLKSVVLHPTCGCVQGGHDQAMREIAEACAEKVTVPLNWGCCGVAGDRGFLHPELSDGAQYYELEEVARESYDGYYSVARTCEISLSQRSAKNYESIVYLVEEATR